MSFRLLMTLTIIEILVLVVVLAVYLVLLTRRLRSIALSLSRVAWGVRAVEVEVGAVGPAVTQVNEVLGELTDDYFPAVADKAQRLAG